MDIWVQFAEAQVNPAAAAVLRELCYPTGVWLQFLIASADKRSGNQSSSTLKGYHGEL